MKYDYKAVEAKWQKVWEDEKTFHVEIDHKKPKFYALVEFPYPSGAGLHVGHPRSYTALDVVSRKRRKNGYNVLYPMGWDAFGLPTENFAMKNHIHPAIVTKSKVDPVDLPAAVQARSGLQEGNERQLVHRLQVRVGQRGSCQRCVRALRQRGGAPRQEPVDAQDHRLCR